MSGLIWSALGQSLGNASATVGNFMMRAEQDEERQRERAELQRERLAATERENQRNRELRAELQAQRGGGSDGGLSARDIGEGGADEGMLARRAGMTVPELRSLRRLSETGDTEPFKREANKVTMKDTGDPYAPDAESQIVRELPPGFESEARAKLQTLAKIEESYRLGGKYDDVTKGRRNQQEVDMSEAAIRRPDAAGVIGQGMAAGKGNDLIGGDSNVTRNKFTGATTMTPIGESQRQENLAQAAKYGEDAKRISDRSDPETMSIRANYTQRERTLRTQIGKAFGPDKEQLQSQLDELIAERKAFDEQVSAAKNNARKPSAAPAPAPAASSAAGGFKVGDTRSVASGPNKGKTVRWDGRGWVLVD